MCVVCVNCFCCFNYRISQLIIELYKWLGYHFEGKDHELRNLDQGHDMLPAGRE